MSRFPCESSITNRGLAYRDKPQYIAKRGMGVDWTPDGRPRGPTPPHPLPARPYYTANRPARPYIVVAGEDWKWGWSPNGNPVRGPVTRLCPPHRHFSSPYLQYIGDELCPYHDTVVSFDLWWNPLQIFLLSGLYIASKCLSN